MIYFAREKRAKDRKNPKSTTKKIEKIIPSKGSLTLMVKKD